jgi:hypothetical protein
MSCRTDIRTPLPRSPRPYCHCQLSSHPSGITCVRALASVHVHARFVPFPWHAWASKGPGRMHHAMPCERCDMVPFRSANTTLVPSPRIPLDIQAVRRIYHVIHRMDQGGGSRPHRPTTKITWAVGRGLMSRPSVHGMLS